MVWNATAATEGGGGACTGCAIRASASELAGGLRGGAQFLGDLVRLVQQVLLHAVELLERVRVPRGVAARGVRTTLAHRAAPAQAPNAKVTPIF